MCKAIVACSTTAAGMAAERGGSSGRGSGGRGSGAGMAATGWKQCGSSDVEADVQERLDVDCDCVVRVIKETF